VTGRAAAAAATTTTTTTAATHSFGHFFWSHCRSGKVWGPIIPKENFDELLVMESHGKVIENNDNVMEFLLLH